MKICILGATGGTGLCLVHNAINAGHKVTTLIRSAPERFGPPHACLTVVTGDLLDTDALTGVVRDQDVVISAFGRRPDSSPTVTEDFSRALVAAMTGAGTSRLICITNSFLFRNELFPRIIGRLFFPKVVRDSDAGEKAVMRSALAWTLIRPPRLTDTPAETYRVRVNGLPPGGFVISRESVARFALAEADSGQYVRQIVGIAR